MSDDARTNLAVGIASDSAGFIRCECPHCGLNFKQEGETDAIQDAVSWSVYRYLSTQGLDTEPGATSGPRQICCPYCARRGEQQDFIHPEIANYIQTTAVREMLEPMLAEAFRGFDDLGHSGGLISIKVSGSMRRSQRPISGPEPDDQVVVQCLACQERFKVDESWKGTIWCPTCQHELLPQ